MSPRASTSVYLMAFWPLVMLALIARLTFGGIVSPTRLIDDPLKSLAKLTILCEEQETSSDPDGQHHHSTNPEDDGFLLSEVFELLVLAVAFCFFMGRVVSGVCQPWMFAPIRGPPYPKRTSLCPQGPPVDLN
ncbi:MAG: hypothetical protein LKH81_04985 [Acetobacter sp.]|jgi:hypothetical protein|nr:hypothetical protein [Acetobacter sp.]MCH4061097.1 hypothetical protein [Acetobacter sp.]MCH4088036.1 hypothetical protein [Acetobacter sp.]MCI1293350.1 hypothetical protein [Acetobacter sp.]MCI1320025.1 hypothetical protein [Acetobacter sp.]